MGTGGNKNFPMSFESCLANASHLSNKCSPVYGESNQILKENTVRKSSIPQFRKRKHLLNCLWWILISHTLQNISAAVTCKNHYNCPKDQICDKHLLPRHSEKQLGFCRCPAGFILWKWNCIPTVPLLNQPCSVSEQCKQDRDPHRHCSPLTKKCICDFDYQEVRSECLLRPKFKMPTTSTESSSSSATTEVDHRKMLITEMVRHINKTILWNSEYEQGRQNASQRNEEEMTFLGLDQDQIHTLIYIGLALLFVICIGTISTFFMKSLKEQRENDAVYKGFMDIMSGDYAGRHGVSSAEFSVSESLSFDQSAAGPEDTNALHEITKPQRIVQNKIILPPLEEGICRPLPNPVAPVLPPIRNPKNFRDRNVEDIRYAIPRPRANGDLEAPTLASISKNLTELNKNNTLDLRPLESLASFPKTSASTPDKNNLDKDLENVTTTTQDEMAAGK